MITLRHPCRLFTITIFCASVLFLLVGLQIFTGNESLASLSDWWGLLVGAMVIYLGCAIALNATFGKMIAPLLIKMPKQGKTEGQVSETP